MRASTLLVAIVVLASGCFGGNRSETSPTPTPTEGQLVYDPAATFSIGYNATQCREGVLLLLVDPSQAQKSLPKGYKARDAQGLFGLPTSSGKGAVYMNANNCGTSQIAAGGVDEGTFGVYVEPPKVEGSRPPSAMDFYEVAHYTSKDEVLRLLKAINASAHEGSITINTNPQPGGAYLGGGDVRNDEGIQLFSFGATAPIGNQAFKGIARFWQDTSNGTILMDYSVDTTIAQGSGTCSARGKQVQDVFGVANCPQGQAFVVMIPNFRWTASIQNLVGVHAQ